MVKNAKKAGSILGRRDIALGLHHDQNVQHLLPNKERVTNSRRPVIDRPSLVGSFAGQLASFRQLAPPFRRRRLAGRYRSLAFLPSLSCAGFSKLWFAHGPNMCARRSRVNRRAIGGLRIVPTPGIEGVSSRHASGGPPHDPTPQRQCQRGAGDGGAGCNAGADQLARLRGGIVQERACCVDPERRARLLRTLERPPRRSRPARPEVGKGGA